MSSRTTNHSRYICVYTYVYIYVHRERERVKERETHMLIMYLPKDAVLKCADRFRGLTCHALLW